MPAHSIDPTAGAPTDPSADGLSTDPVLDAALARAVGDLRNAVGEMPLPAASPPSRRPAPHRIRIVVAVGLAVSTVAAAAGVVYLRSQADQLRRVHVDGLAPVDPSAPVEPAASAPGGTAASPGAVPGSDPTTPIADTLAPPATLSRPINLLVVGVDTRADGSVLGTRSDTIAIVRLDPATGRVAVLSIPRDLWVTVAGTGSRGRINSLLADGDPSVLVATIHATFGIDIHHYVAIDFAGFQDLVDLAGGVDIPFTTPVRDAHTGFSASAGCQHLDGGEALAYVRARYLQHYDAASGSWVTDPVSDLSRIARQQDLVRRMYTAVLAADYGVTDQLAILTDVVDDITVDDGLDLDGLRSLFAAARTIGPAGFVSYNLTDVVSPRTIDGNAVLVATDGLGSVVDRFLHGDRSDPSSPVPAGAIVPAPEVTC